MKTRQLLVARTLTCGLLVLGGVAFGCDARVEALGESESELSTPYPNPDICPDAPTDVMRNADEFANTEKRSPCDDVPAGTTCAYDVRNTDGAYTGFAAYVCGCEVESNWMNVGTANSGYACPDLAPLEGAPCEPLPNNENCVYYPNQFADCLGGTWQYQDGEGPRYPCSLLGVVKP